MGGPLLILWLPETGPNGIKITIESRTFVRHWFWVPIVIVIMATILIIPWDRISEWMTRVYVKYFLSISNAPLYINHPDYQIRDIAKKILSGKIR